MLPLRPRRAARQDIEAAIDFYRAEGGEPLALRFIDALQNATSRLARHPAAGSPRHGFELGIEGLRAWPLRRFPHLLFYRPLQDHIDLWRLLHTSRDIPAWLQT